MANPRPDEKALALWAVEQVRKFGGVLEHPANSTLWATQKLPLPRDRDQYGGWTLPIVQQWWGHRAEKRTWLYIVGCAQQDIPPLPMTLGEAPCICGTSGRRRDGTRLSRRPEITKAEREHTPPALAAWLVELAAKCKTPNVADKRRAEGTSA